MFDFNTKNESFLKIHRQLKEKGIKNNAFFLYLKDESLQGIDPTREDLPLEIRIRIYRECQCNYWYYIREVVRISVAGDKIRYELSYGNLALSWCRQYNLDVYLILPRQHGKTHSNVTYDAWVFDFATTNTEIMYLNKSHDDAKGNLRRFMEIREAYPKWLKEMVIGKDDINSAERKISKLRNNRLLAKSPPSSYFEANNKGRGLSAAILYLDEWAFTRFNAVVWKSASPANSKASELAKASGVPYGKIITTTPNDIDTDEGNFAYRMMTDAAKFKLELFDLSYAAVMDYISKNAKNTFIFIQFTWRELGDSEEWYAKQCKELLNDKHSIMQEINLDWSVSSRTSFFTEEQLEPIANNLKQVQFSIPVGEYYIDFYEEPAFDKNLILSADIAGGLQDENTALTVIDPTDFRIVGEFQSNKIDTEEFGNLLLLLMTRFFPISLLVIEKCGISLNIIDRLKKNPSIERRMFYTFRDRGAEKKMANGLVVKQKTKTKVYGVETNKDSRTLMLGLLCKIVEDEPELLCTPNMYRDLKNLERKATGRIEHKSGCTDDTVFSYMFTRYALNNFDWFQKMWGIMSVANANNSKVVDTSEVEINKASKLIRLANADDKLLFQAIAENRTNPDEEKPTNKNLDFARRVSSMNIYNFGKK